MESFFEGAATVFHDKGKSQGAGAGLPVLTVHIDPRFGPVLLDHILYVIANRLKIRRNVVVQSIGDVHKVRRLTRKPVTKRVSGRSSVAQRDTGWQAAGH